MQTIYGDFYSFLFVLYFYKVIVHEELNIKSEDTIRMLDFRYATITFNIIYLIVKHFSLINSDIFSTPFIQFTRNLKVFIMYNIYVVHIQRNHVSCDMANQASC